MEEKLLHGSEAMDKAMRQEQELLKHKAELEDQRREQLKLEQDIRARNEEKSSLQMQFSNQKEELENKNQEIDTVWKRYQSTK